MDECAVCGELLDDEAHNTVQGKPVCTDAAACVRRWYAQTKGQRRARIRRLDPATNVETR